MRAFPRAGQHAPTPPTESSTNAPSSSHGNTLTSKRSSINFSASMLVSARVALLPRPAHTAHSFHEMVTLSLLISSTINHRLSQLRLDGSSDGRAAARGSAGCLSRVLHAFLLIVRRCWFEIFRIDRLWGICPLLSLGCPLRA